MTNSLTMSLDRGLDKLLGVPGDVGCPIPADAGVIDLGCGHGRRVRALIDRGFDAYGCDIRFKAGRHREAPQREERIRPIGLSPYALPFDSACCDFLFSEQVFEHVQNYDETLAEIAKIKAKEDAFKEGLAEGLPYLEAAKRMGLKQV